MKAQDGLVIPPSGQRLWNGEPTASTCPFGQMILCDYTIQMRNYQGELLKKFIKVKFLT